MGDRAGARASLRRALDLDPNSVEAYVNLGLLHWKAGTLSEAVQTWECALQLDPAHPLARISPAQAAASGTSVA